MIEDLKAMACFICLAMSLIFYTIFCVTGGNKMGIMSLYMLGTALFNQP